MPEVFRALVESVNQTVNKLTEELEETQVALDVMQKKIDRLPKDYLPRTEAEKKARRFKRILSGIVIGGVLSTGVFGTVLYLNHSVTCGVRGILVSAETASTRNPLSPALSDQEREVALAQRRQAEQFYKDSLHKLKILWPCAGEKAGK